MIIQELELLIKTYVGMILRFKDSPTKEKFEKKIGEIDRKINARKLGKPVEIDCQKEKEELITLYRTLIEENRNEAEREQ